MERSTSRALRARFTHCRARAAALLRPMLAVSTCLLFFASAEGLCRVVGWGEPRVVAFNIANWERQWDGEFYVLEPREGVNPDGLRDITHEIEKPDGVRRLVFLGDSVTYGHKLPPGQSYPDFLRQVLASGERPVEIFNVSLPGWSTRQERIAYQRIVRAYRPDMVVVGFCLNDVAELQNNLTRPSRALSWSYQHSYLVRALMDPAEHEIQEVNDLFGAPHAPEVRRGWERTFSELSELRREVEADGAGFGLLVLPFRFQTSLAAAAPVAQEELRAFAEREGIPFLDALPTLRALGAGGFVDYNHLSPTGARAVAKALSRSDLIDNRAASPLSDP